MKTVAIVVLSVVLSLIIGIYIGTIKAYGFFAGAIEERVIRDANTALMQVGAKRYELVVDNGTVMVMRRMR